MDLLGAVNEGCRIQTFSNQHLNCLYEELEMFCVIFTWLKAMFHGVQKFRHVGELEPIQPTERLTDTTKHCKRYVVIVAIHVIHIGTSIQPFLILFLCLRFLNSLLEAEKEDPNSIVCLS